MNTIKNLERLQQLHELIKTERTGTPGELAKQIRISKRLVYKLLEHLKDYKANICYDRCGKTYYYCDDFQFRVNISVTVNGCSDSADLFKGSYLSGNRH